MWRARRSNDDDNNDDDIDDDDVADADAADADAEEDEDEGDFDPNSRKRGAAHISIDQFAFDDGGDFFQDAMTAPNAAIRRMIPTLSSSAADQLVPFNVVSGRDPDAVRPEASVVDSVSFYNQPSLLILLHAHATQGMPAPLFDAEKQTMVTKKLFFDF
jgi:hypothetical protein